MFLNNLNSIELSKSNIMYCTMPKFEIYRVSNLYQVTPKKLFHIDLNASECHYIYRYKFYINSLLDYK